MGRPILLQEKRSSYYSSISLQKQQFDNRLQALLAIINPFNAHFKSTRTISGQGFIHDIENVRTVRQIRLTLQYNFGSLKKELKKIEHGIVNDDLKK